jgi:DNA-binding transcriptional LysR family regulator
MRVFVRVMERRNFAQAADDLGLSRSTVSEAIQAIEKRLGVRLLQRTTRLVRPTVEGQEFYDRCRAILADIENAEAAFSKAPPSGPLRIDVHGDFARWFLLPALPEFLEAFPEIRLHIGEGDRLVDLVNENVDCVIRVGEPKDSSLLVRRVGWLKEGTFASPDYLARHGLPSSPEDLAGHKMIGFVSSATDRVIPLEFRAPTGLRQLTLPCTACVTSAATYTMLAKMGLGLIQAPRYKLEPELVEGTLVEVLPAFPPDPSPVSILFPERRQVSPRVRVFVDWAVATLSKTLPSPD